NPLSLPECACIGRSIAKWTHQRMSEKAFAQYVADTHTAEIQAARGRKGGIISKRGAVADSERTLKPWDSLGISRRWYYHKKKNGLL
ncbi:plasmid replication protein, partial [Xenorhabdus bovienii]|nr:plasmid replication protein [Xenorhabdus bovienii]